MAKAVEVRNGYKYYGNKSNPKIILNHLNMSVMRGSIYGLLGASGCGKTTLLSCIVGQRQLHSGDIKVLGLPPGTPGSGIPGARVGFMPQEIALIEEMSVKENIYYFGRIYGMTEENIYEKFKILHSLLQLPPSKHLLKQCSGGQQRRISFACAMIHDPELLILDEPTVGLDPVLREKIWDFLVESTRSSKLAVIITTHYIEEAKQANYIGLMRNGVLLAEDTPYNIMNRFEVNTLENAFLILSQQQGVNQTINIQNNDKLYSNVFYKSDKNNDGLVDNTMLAVITEHKNLMKMENIKINLNGDSCLGTKTQMSKFIFKNPARIKALMIKNFVQLFRQPSGVIFMLLFPIIDLACFYLAIGKTPTNLNIGIVNSEFTQWQYCYDPNLVTVISSNDTCNFYNISCRYITEIDSTHDLKKIFYNNLEDAYHDAKKAKIWGYIHFSSNFSASLQSMIENGRRINDYDLQSAEIAVHMDMTDHQISFFVQQKLREYFGKFIRNLLTDCKFLPALADIPINFQPPVYGSDDIEFQQYVAPGVIMTMVFFLAALMTSAVFISERLGGVWDRTLVAGVSKIEMLWAHLLNQLVIMIFQSCEVIMYVGLIFDTYNKGSTGLLILLLTLNSFCGMLYGLLISIYCKSHTEANFVATGTFYPMIILCGLLWPLEGMPHYLQNIVLYFPFTLPCISARNIIEKGWNLSNSAVYDGFLVMLAWILIFFCLCIIGIKRKS